MAVKPTRSPNTGRPSRGFRLETVLFVLSHPNFYKEETLEECVTGEKETPL